MQTGLFINRLPLDLPAPAVRLQRVRRALRACRRWFSSYDLGTDEKIRRFTGAR